jgi:histone-binding protein RBBP4
MPSTLAYDIGYFRWKRNIPLLYDNLLNYSNEWPGLSLQWGPLESGDDAHGSRYFRSQKLYVSERTDARFDDATGRWVGKPGMLLQMSVDVARPRAADRRRLAEFDETRRTPFVTVTKRIVHPGEVNRIRCAPGQRSLVGTHADSPHVYIWRMASQRNRSMREDSRANAPDMVLVGHTQAAEYALDFSPVPGARRVVSGGSDRTVLMWDLDDYAGSSRATAGAGTAGSAGSAKRPRGAEAWWAGEAAALAPRAAFEGHAGPVEDAQFHPTSRFVCCSVGDDRQLLLWDERAGTRPQQRAAEAHDDDINCVSWSAQRPEHVLTGSSDGLIKLWDVRRLPSGFGPAPAAAGRDSSSRSPSRSPSKRKRRAPARADGDGAGAAVGPLCVFRGHDAPVMTVQWMPGAGAGAGQGLFCSSAEDSVVMVWDVALAMGAASGAEASGASASRAGASGADASKADASRADASGADASGADADASRWSGRLSFLNGFAGATAAPSGLLPVADRDHSPASPAREPVGTARRGPTGALFKHVGHRGKIVDVHWNPLQPWTFASLSDDSTLTGEGARGGGTMQIFRPTEVVHDSRLIESPVLAQNLNAD